MVVNASLRDKPQSVARSLTVERVPFIKQAGMKSLAELAHMSEGDIVELCIHYPKAAGQLIIDLYQAWGLASADVGTLKADLDEYKRLYGEQVIENGELQKALDKIKGAKK